MQPRCPYYGSCGGCQLQHLPYEEQLEIKTAKVRELVGGEIKVAPALGMDDPWFYRNKIQFPIREQNNRLQMGYFKQRTHEVVNIKECYTQDPHLTAIAQIAREIFEDRELSAYDEKTGKGLLRHFVGRSGFQTGEILLGFVINGRKIPAGFSVADKIKKHEREMRRLAACRRGSKPRIVGIVQNVNTARGNVIMGKQNTTLMGIPFLREKLGKFVFKIGLLSFFQVNPVQAVKLYGIVKKFAELSGSETVIDAYAGIGAIASWLADKAGEVIGIEEREEAVKDANQNISLNKLSNVNMIYGMAEKSFPDKADVIILDPPRGGCSDKALEIVMKAKPKRIIYVSCNPETMARDIKMLEDYQVEIIQPVDMFPQTDHIESVVKLCRGS